MLNKRVRLAVAILVLLLGVPVLFALPEYSWRITYYSDASMQTWVGSELHLCSGTTTIGTTSAYTNYSIIKDCQTGQPHYLGEAYQSNCNDMVDNDGDTLTDAADPDCW